MGAPLVIQPAAVVVFVGDGVGGDVCCGVEDDRARAQVAAAALLLLGWEERRIQAREAQIHGDGG